MGLEKLSKITDAEYKLLSPQELMAYNREMPEQDYSKQYSHIAYPKAKYQLRDLPGGGQRLVSVEVANREAEAKLVGDWRDNPMAWGVITHPETDPIAVDTGFSFDVPQAIAPQVAVTSGPRDPDETDPGSSEPEPGNAPVGEPPGGDEGSGASARPTRRR